MTNNTPDFDCQHWMLHLLHEYSCAHLDVFPPDIEFFGVNIYHNVRLFWIVVQWGGRLSRSTTQEVRLYL